MSNYVGQRGLCSLASSEQTSTPANSNTSEQKKFNIPERENMLYYYVHTHICAVKTQVSAYLCATLTTAAELALPFFTFYPRDVKNGACSHTFSEDKSKEM